MDFKLQLNQNELDLNFKGFGECSNHTIFKFRGLDDLCEAGAMFDISFFDNSF